MLFYMFVYLQFSLFYFLSSSGAFLYCQFMGPAVPVVHEKILFFPYLGLKPCVFCIFYISFFFASVFCKDYLCSLYEGTICARNFKGPSLQAFSKGPSVPATLRDHLCSLYEGTICARSFKGPSVPAILRDHLCPQR